MIQRPQTFETDSPDSKAIRSVFDSICEPYDLLNTVLSFGLDHRWRRILASKIKSERPVSILDLGAGTGKSLNAILEACSVERTVGCDFSGGMLLRAQNRLRNRAHLVACDFHQLPFMTDSFNIVTGSFILRSVRDLKAFFQGIRPALRRGGKAIFLELTRPTHGVFKRLVYDPYVRYYLPWIGGTWSKSPSAYQFLSDSVQSFMEPTDLKDIMEEAGFSDISIQTLSFGVATIIEGVN